MKHFKPLAQVLTASTIALATLAIGQAPSRAEASRFYCGSSDGSPATIAQTRQGREVPVIFWNSDYFSDAGYTPEVRCEMVSQRFETFRKNGTLDYLTTGKMNNMPVVCVSDGIGRGCAANGLLFTLKAGSNPNRVLEDLMAVRHRASGARLYESSLDSQPVLQNDTNTGNLYVNLAGFLNAVEEEIAPSSDNDSVF